MSTPRLHIQQLSLLSSDHWLAISFSGPREQYVSLIQALRAENYRNVYWHAGYFGNRQGAWIISMFLLPRYADRFDNLQAKLAEAQACYHKAT